MQRIKRILLSAPSLRLNTTILLEVILLVIASLAVLFYFSRKMLKQESMQNAEQTLEATSLQVDNILLNVEQMAGNIYYDLIEHLDDPELMYTYCRKIVECNPYVEGCAIAFKPNYYPGRDLFMPYIHSKSLHSQELIASEMYGSKPYVEQAWYLEPMKTGQTCWMDPQKDMVIKATPIISFCLPVIDRNHERIGVLGIDLSVEMLSEYVLSHKSSPNSYCLLLDNKGAFIIHPERDKLLNKTVFSLSEYGTNPDLREATKAMLAGETGNRSFHLNGEAFYAFYKPFVKTLVPGRAINKLNWSIGIVYPINDIAAPYRSLFFHVLLISAAGLLVFFLLCRFAFRRLMRPVRKLTYLARDISEGKYDEEVPNTGRTDEIGLFQQHFQHMQQALISRIKEKEQLMATLQQRRDDLQKTYNQVQKDNELKWVFLQKISDQLINPAEVINTCVQTLCDEHHSLSKQETQHAVESIKKQSLAILELLNKLFKSSENEARKEECDE